MVTTLVTTTGTRQRNERMGRDTRRSNGPLSQIIVPMQYIGVFLFSRGILNSFKTLRPYAEKQINYIQVQPHGKQKLTCLGLCLFLDSPYYTVMAYVYFCFYTDWSILLRIAWYRSNSER